MAKLKQKRNLSLFRVMKDCSCSITNFDCNKLFKKKKMFNLILYFFIPHHLVDANNDETNLTQTYQTSFDSY